jgi:anti-sigma-K factor RskA
MTGKRKIDPAEFALGLLDGEDLRAARLLAASDPGFARDVARWNGRLAPLLDEVDPAPPPGAVWPRVERALGTAPGESNVVALRRKVNVWRGMAGAMTALAASLALVVVDRSSAPSPAPVSAPAGQPMVAMIKAGGEVAAVANWDHSARTLMVAEVKMPAVPDRDYQLWVIPADGKPRSVGVMPNMPHMRMALAQPMAAMLAEGATLAVSLEPLGGSPTDVPTGPVVASGALAAA